jgi:hypothetical protein
MNLEPTDHRRAVTAGDLERQAARSPIVAHHLNAWRAGVFASFEECLLTLAVNLAGVNERYVAAACERVRRAMADDVTADFVIGVAPGKDVR